MTDKQEKALAALMESDTQKEAAKKAGITARTLRNYMKDADFVAEYTSRKGHVVDDAARQIQGSLHTAINALRAIVEGREKADGGKISASRALLEYGLRYTEISDIISRLEALERTDGSGGFEE